MTGPVLVFVIEGLPMVIEGDVLIANVADMLMSAVILLTVWVVTAPTELRVPPVGPACTFAT